MGDIPAINGCFPCKNAKQTLNLRNRQKLDDFRCQSVKIRNTVVEPLRKGQQKFLWHIFDAPVYVALIQHLVSAYSSFKIRLRHLYAMEENNFFDSANFFIIAFHNTVCHDPSNHMIDKAPDTHYLCVSRSQYLLIYLPLEDQN